MHCLQKEMVFLSIYHVLGCAYVLPKCGMWDHMRSWPTIHICTPCVSQLMTFIVVHGFSKVDGI